MNPDSITTGSIVTHTHIGHKQTHNGQLHDNDVGSKNKKFVDHNNNENKKPRLTKKENIEIVYFVSVSHSFTKSHQVINNEK